IFRLRIRLKESVMIESPRVTHRPAPSSALQIPPALQAPAPRPVQPRKQKQTWSDTLAALALILVVTLLPWSYVALRLKLARHGEDVPGTIVSRSTSKSRSGVHYTIKYRYEVNGRRFTGAEDIDFDHYYNPFMSRQVTIRRMHMLGVEWNAMFDMGSK